VPRLKSNISVRRLHSKDIYAANDLVIKTINDLRAKHSMQPYPGPEKKKRNLLMDHLLQTDPSGSFGAFSGRKMVGYSAAMIRDGHWYLAFLFVDSNHQGKGIGRRLLNRSLLITREEDIHTHSLATFAFNAPAVGLYTAYGFHPIEALPMMGWKAKPGKPLRRIRNDIHFRIISITEYDQISILNKLDKKNRGIYRPEEHKFWMDSPNIKGYLFYDGRKLAGYSMIIRDEIIAPVNVTKPVYLIPVLTEMINMHRRPNGGELVLWVPGKRGDVLEFLIKHGFSMRELEILMSDRMFFNLDCYLPATLAFF
jgi:GNAT superfamily N-acetyltransferase